MATVGSAETRYGAFISYSHVDRRVARQLHRRLERYRIPRKLAGSDGRRGAIPSRLGRLFRDLDELPAADDLSAEVRAALAASDSLIVICSPAAAASQWVAREIELFRQLNPGGPVLAALIDGEPAQAIPAPLWQSSHGEAAEPLAADFRRGRDGQRLGLLKLVAGVVGVPLDTLVQRDAQARLRSVMAVTLVAFAAVLAMAALTIVALRARAEAEDQRVRAEELVEFMLTDLRDELKKVGRLDVLRSANERALAYYTGQDLDDQPATSLARQARAMMTWGEDEDKAGEPARATKAFNQAYRATEALIARNPDDPEIIFAHAQSEFWMGSLAFGAKDFRTAEQHFIAYERLAGRLALLTPDDPRGLKEVAYATGNLCTLRLAQDEKAHVVTLCARSLGAMAEVARRQPGDKAQRDIVNRRGWLADAYVKVGDLEAARRQRLAQIAILDALSTRDPRNVLNHRLRIWADRALARIELRMGDTATGTARLRGARAALRRLVAADPKDQELAASLKRMNAELVTVEGDKP
ncbi:hypothetical protein BH11PSE6_BH11PSE6_23480 [soil metagenome]